MDSSSVRSLARQLLLLQMVLLVAAAHDNKALRLLRFQICDDLCSAGLGGAPCGECCSNGLGFELGLKMAANRVQDKTGQVDIYGPRRSACPLLCQKNLGDPLCRCNTLAPVALSAVDWPALCHSYCQQEGYLLDGCQGVLPGHRCVTLPNTRPQPLVQVGVASAAEDQVDWEDLCNYLCRQGDGGAACNCDRVP